MWQEAKINIQGKAIDLLFSPSKCIYSIENEKNAFPQDVKLKFNLRFSKCSKFKWVHQKVWSFWSENIASFDLPLSVFILHPKTEIPNLDFNWKAKMELSVYLSKAKRSLLFFFFFVYQHFLRLFPFAVIIRIFSFTKVRFHFSSYRL